METIIAETLRKLHDISIHSNPDDIEQQIACFYAVEDALEDARTAATVLGIAL